MVVSLFQEKHQRIEMVFSSWISALEKLRSAVVSDTQSEAGVGNQKNTRFLQVRDQEQDDQPASSFDLDDPRCAAHQDTSLVSSSPSNTDFIYIAQLETWDCGVACLLMVWSWLASNGTPSRSQDDIHQQRKFFLNAIGSQSIWTIDLAFALDQMKDQREKGEEELVSNFTYQFSSNMLEANAEWKDYTYYAAAFDKDEQRTRQRLNYLKRQSQQATRHGCTIHQQNKRQSISWVIDCVRLSSTVAILLVDNSVLQTCLTNTSKSFETAQQSPSSRYAGHYVVVSGTCTDEHVTSNGQECGRGGMLVVYDPNFGMRNISAHHLELAWQAQGTDQDVILVQKL